MVAKPNKPHGTGIIAQPALYSPFVYRFTPGQVKRRSRRADLSFENILTPILLYSPCLLFSLCVHEAAHGAGANWCGDPSAKMLGRVTLNPLPHIDPIGTVVMPLAMLLMPGAGFLVGWAKPVPFNPRNLRNPRRDPVLIALAGPGSNLLTALVAAIGLRVLVLSAWMVGSVTGAMSTFAVILVALITVNIALMLFNLIPLPPLDGHHVLEYFLPYSARRYMDAVAPYSIFIIILLGPMLLRTPMGILMSLLLGPLQ